MTQLKSAFSHSVQSKQNRRKVRGLLEDVWRDTEPDWVKTKTTVPSATEIISLLTESLTSQHAELI